MEIAKKQKKLWVQQVKDTSFAIDLPMGIFTHSPEKIAQLLKPAVLESNRTNKISISYVNVELLYKPRW